MGPEYRLRLVVGDIYDAALDPQRWSSTLARVSNLLGSSGATLLLGNPQGTEAAILHATGIDPAALSLYDAHYVHQDVRLQALFPRPVGTIATNSRLLPETEFVHTEFCHDFLRRFDFHYMVGCVLIRSDEMFSSLGIHRPKRRGEYSEHEVRLYATVLPHLQRAVEINLRLSAAESQRNANDDVLDRVPVGIILLDGRGHPLRVNTIAQAILEQRDGLEVSDERLYGARTDITAVLRNLIHCSAQTGMGRATFPGGLVSLPRPSGKRPLSVLVTPLRTSPGAWGLRGVAAAVLVTDPESRVEARETLLQRFYGLTMAEARLAKGLLQGRSLKETADELGITRETGRTHLRRVFDKTDTRRQSELIRALLKTPMQIRQTR